MDSRQRKESLKKPKKGVKSRRTRGLLSRSEPASNGRDRERMGLPNLGKRITSTEVKRLRQQTQLSQEKFAHLLGTSWVTVSRWERNQVTPTGEMEACLLRL